MKLSIRLLKVGMATLETKEYFNQNLTQVIETPLKLHQHDQANNH